jgi:5-oxoprolinase (ATP-hydrolysing) subunit A
MTTIDLNADLGEGFGSWRLGDDDALLNVVTSANVACGFHAGDPSLMHRVCTAAAAKGVVVGAQVGYRDLAGFGRRRIEYDLAELRDDILYQIGALEAFGRVAGIAVRYVKPHGALYNTAAVDEGQASAVVAAIRAYDRSLPVLCQPGSVLYDLAERDGLTAVGEGFADRGYRADGTLVPRSAPGAVIHDPDVVAARAVRMAAEQTVVAVDGTVVPCAVRSICVHGDTPGAVELAGRVREALGAVSAFVEPAEDQRQA